MTDPENQFIEQMGLVVQAEGGPRIAGRVFGLLLLADGPLSLNQVAERLQISKGSASTNARLLADRGLLRLSVFGDGRQDYYELVPNFQQHMLDLVGTRMRAASDQLGSIGELFPAGTASGDKVRRLVSFYKEGAELLARWAERSNR